MRAVGMVDGMAFLLPPGVKPYDPTPRPEEPDPNFVPHDARTKEPAASPKQRARARAKQARMLKQYEKAFATARKNPVPHGYFEKLLAQKMEEVRKEKEADERWRLAHQDD